MFDRLSQVAEALATGVSRRGFVGSIGRWAGATALAMAGVLTAANQARAGAGKTCCIWASLSGCLCTACVPLGSPCPPSPCGTLISPSTRTVHDCGACRC